MPAALTAAGSLALALGFSACENVAGYTQPSLVRVIDASYIAPAVNATVEGTLPASADAVIKVTAGTGGTTLVSADGTLLAGHQHSVFLTDNGAAPTSYTVTVLEDQQVAAEGRHSAFRFLNQAPKAGALDIYMVPSGSTLADTIPLVTALPVGSTAGYISFVSQTVTMVITPTGLTTPKYTSPPGFDRRRGADSADCRYPVDQQSARRGIHGQRRELVLGRVIKLDICKAAMLR